MHHERRNMNENNSNDLQTIITQVIEEMKSEQGDKFDINRINLAEMERRTGMTRAQLRRLKKNDFQITPHALTGRKADTTIISGYTGVIDDPNNDKFDEDGWLKNDWTIDYNNPSNTLLANDFLFASVFRAMLISATPITVRRKPSFTTLPLVARRLIL